MADATVWFVSEERPQSENARSTASTPNVQGLWQSFGLYGLAYRNRHNIGNGFLYDYSFDTVPRLIFVIPTVPILRRKGQVLNGTHLHGPAFALPDIKLVLFFHRRNCQESPRAFVEKYRKRLDRSDGIK